MVNKDNVDELFTRGSLKWKIQEGDNFVLVLKLWGNCSGIAARWAVMLVESASGVDGDDQWMDKYAISLIITLHC